MPRRGNIRTVNHFINLAINQWKLNSQIALVLNFELKPHIQPTFKLYIAYGDFVKSVKMRAMVISLVSICMALALFHEARMHSELGSMNVSTKLLGIHSKALKTLCSRWKTLTSLWHWREDWSKSWWDANSLTDRSALPWSLWIKLCTYSLPADRYSNT